MNDTPSLLPLWLTVDVMKKGELLSLVVDSLHGVTHCNDWLVVVLTGPGSFLRGRFVSFDFGGRIFRHEYRYRTVH